MPAPLDPEALGLAVSLRVAYPSFSCHFELDAPPAGVTALFGKSGSGKTTCLRLLAGLERGQGRLHLGGECWQDDARNLFVPTHRRGVGYVFQEPSLFPHLSVRENLRYAERRARRAARATEFGALVGVLGIEPLLARAPSRLSGGERQRVAIARALLAAPRLLLMDEPLASLDEERKAEVLPYLEALRREIGVPIIYVSHSIAEVARLADHLALLDAGRVVAAGPLAEMLARLDLALAQEPEAAVVIEANVGLKEPHDGLTRLDFAGDSLWVTTVDCPVGSSVRARVLARDVSLALEPPGPSSILNVLRASVVELAAAAPHQVNVRLALERSGVPLLARITSRSREVLGLRPGSAVYAQVKGVALLT